MKTEQNPLREEIIAMLRQKTWCTRGELVSNPHFTSHMGLDAEIWAMREEGLLGSHIRDDANGIRARIYYLNGAALEEPVKAAEQPGCGTLIAIGAIGTLLAGIIYWLLP